MMSYPELKQMRVGDRREAKAYLRWLASRGLTYHLDDAVSTVVWREASPTPSDLGEMGRLARELWSVCDPWKLMLQDEKLWREYTGMDR